MIRFLLKLSIPLIIAFTAFSIAARALGTTQPPNPALAGFTEGCEDKPQPCWYGIVPGVTPWNEVEAIVKNLGFAINSSGQGYISVRPIAKNPFCANAEIESSFKGTTVGSISLNECKGVTLHDVLTFACCPDGYVIGNGSLWMRTFNGQFALESPEGSESPRWLLSFSITRIWMFDAHLPVKFQWRGFVPARRYCELEVNPMIEGYC